MRKIYVELTLNLNIALHKSDKANLKNASSHTKLTGTKRVTARHCCGFSFIPQQDS